jgi:hypothetical protein
MLKEIWIEKIVEVVRCKQIQQPLENVIILVMKNRKVLAQLLNIIIF